MNIRRKNVIIIIAVLSVILIIAITAIVQYAIKIFIHSTDLLEWINGSTDFAFSYKDHLQEFSIKNRYLFGPISWISFFAVPMATLYYILAIEEKKNIVGSIILLVILLIYCAGSAAIFILNYKIEYLLYILMLIAYLMFIPWAAIWAQKLQKEYDKLNESN